MQLSATLKETDCVILGDYGILRIIQRSLFSCIGDLLGTFALVLAALHADQGDRQSHTPRR